MTRAAYDRQFHEWETLLREARDHEAELAGIASLRKTLEIALSRAAATRGMRDTLQLTTRDMSRRLHEALDAGNKAAGGLRRAVKRAQSAPETV